MFISQGLIEHLQCRSYLMKNPYCNDIPPGAAVISLVVFDVCVIWQVSGWEGSSYTVRTTDVVATSLTLAVSGAVALAVEALLGVRTPGEQDDEQIIYNRHLLKI